MQSDQLSWNLIYYATRDHFNPVCLMDNTDTVDTPGHHNHKHTAMQNSDCSKWLLVPPMCIIVKHCCFIASLGFLWDLQPSDITLSPINGRGTWIHMTSHWNVGWKVVAFLDKTAGRKGGCGWVNLVWKPRRETCFINTVPTQWENSCPPNIFRQW
jgi:hypothetical protein